MINTPIKIETLKIPEITNKYPKQWVMVEIVERDKYGWPFQGKVLVNSSSEEEAIEKAVQIEGEDLYFFYTGCIDD
jgi:hypothetical protein